MSKISEYRVVQLIEHIEGDLISLAKIQIIFEVKLEAGHAK